MSDRSVKPVPGVDRLRADWRALVEAGEVFEGTGLGELSTQMRDAGEWPEDVRRSAVIVDTDVGGDADDALALVVAARRVHELALVVTNDETGPTLGYGQRARFARALLDLAGREGVPVVAGATSSDTRYFCVEGLIPDSIPEQPTDIVAAVRAVYAATEGPVRWVGMGPLTNLARLLREAPELGPRLRVTQMGGALNYRDPRKAEHNVRMDAPAARAVLQAVGDGLLPTPEWVTSDVTFTPRMQVTVDSPIYRALAADESGWARLLIQHMDRWFERFYPHTIQHDALTLSAALELPFVDSDKVAVEFDEIGRMSATATGVPVWLSVSARYEAFMAWLAAALDPESIP
jgi:inosine-uridine nucleoside N-ribohydrolase